MKTLEEPVAVFIFALKRDNENYPCAGEGEIFMWQVNFALKWPNIDHYEIYVISIAKLLITKKLCIIYLYQFQGIRFFTAVILIVVDSDHQFWSVIVIKLSWFIHDIYLYLIWLLVMLYIKLHFDCKCAQVICHRQGQRAALL